SEGAVAAYRNALSLDSQYAVVRYQLALVLIERREFRAAEQELLLALDAVPTYGEATLTLASLRRTQSRANEALPLLIEPLQRDPYHFDALIAIREPPLAVATTQDAATAFARGLRCDPSHVSALHHDG